jgi:hypothetical protein
MLAHSHFALGRSLMHRDQPALVLRLHAEPNVIRFQRVKNVLFAVFALVIRVVSSHQ